MKTKTLIFFIAIMGLFIENTFAQYVCDGDCINGNGIKKVEGTKAYMKGRFEEGILKEGTVAFPNGDKFVGKFEGNFLKEGSKFFHTGRRMDGLFFHNVLVKGKITEPDGSSRMITLNKRMLGK